jgi:hypothetical protein
VTTSLVQNMEIDFHLNGKGLISIQTCWCGRKFVVLYTKLSTTTSSFFIRPYPNYPYFMNLFECFPYLKIKSSIDPLMQYPKLSSEV